MAGEPLVRRKTRKRGAGINFSIYFPKESLDILDHLHELVDEGKIVSVSKFVCEAVLDKYKTEFSTLTGEDQ